LGTGLGFGLGDGFGEGLGEGFGEAVVVVGDGGVDVLLVDAGAPDVVGAEDAEDVEDVEGAGTPLVLGPTGSAVLPKETPPQPASAVAPARRVAARAVRVPGRAVRIVSPWPVVGRCRRSSSLSHGDAAAGVPVVHHAL
jgi:hypothetical protein